MLDGNVIDTNEEQFLKTSLPRVEMLGSNLTEVSDEQSRKAPLPKVVIRDGNDIFLTELPSNS